MISVQWALNYLWLNCRCLNQPTFDINNFVSKKAIKFIFMTEFSCNKSYYCFSLSFSRVLSWHLQKKDFLQIMSLVFRQSIKIFELKLRHHSSAKHLKMTSTANLWTSHPFSSTIANSRCNLFNFLWVLFFHPFKFTIEGRCCILGPLESVSMVVVVTSKIGGCSLHFY